MQLSTLLAILVKLSENFESVFVCGGFNMDSLTKNINSSMLYDVAESYGMISLFDKPSSIGTLGKT